LVLNFFTNCTRDEDYRYERELIKRLKTSPFQIISPIHGSPTITADPGQLSRYPY
jgi:hypothetical protein